jgi:glycosyltransferase involved in cell wall biosynthesis
VNNLRVALVHDWMVSPGGGERVLLELHRIWPDAPIYTAAYVPERFPEFADADVRPTWLDTIPFAKTKHQFFPILRGMAFRSLDLSDYDVVISSCSAESKYVRTGPKTLHICYCHTPIRYYWSDYEWYMKHPPFGVFNFLARVVLAVGLKSLQRLDYRRAQEVDAFIANSTNVQKRISRYYDRQSVVIYPPILTDLFQRPRDPKDFYVIVGRQVAYKRLDLAIQAFNELKLPLKVVGAGEEIARQQPLARENIEFLGRVSDEERSRLLAEAKAFIFPPEEDFGMAPVEAMAAGCPVVAYGRGGALEFMTEGVTGTLFSEQTPEALMAAVQRLEGMRLKESDIRARAKEFDVSVFRERMSDFVKQEWERFNTAKRQ